MTNIERCWVERAGGLETKAAENAVSKPRRNSRLLVRDNAPHDPPEPRRIQHSCLNEEKDNDASVFIAISSISERETPKPRVTGNGRGSRNII